MSLLIIRCPFKPFLGRQGDDFAWDASKAEEFSWSLLDGSDSEDVMLMGPIEAMPYAEKVLVLIPTLDVRLIEMKIPLVGEKKIQAILPGLLEDHLLGGIQQVRALVLPPVPGADALMRTVAILDRAWFDWIVDQLTKLLSPHILLVPDCFLLAPLQIDFKVKGDNQVSDPSIAYEFFGPNIIWTVRLNALLGASWIEHMKGAHPSSPDLKNYLPTRLQKIDPALFSWNLLLSHAERFLRDEVYRGINLLPKSFRLTSRSPGKRQEEGDVELVGHEGNWLVWHTPLRWLLYCVCSLLIGFVAHLSWVAIADWRWTSKMEELAIPYLAESSIASVSSDQNRQTILHAFTHQVTQDKRCIGLTSDADFSALSNKLQRLNALYGGRLVSAIYYNGYDMEFEVDLKAVDHKSYSATQLVQQARALDLGVVFISGNRFRISPYAGLGVDL